MPVSIKTLGAETRRNLVPNPAFRSNLTDWTTRTGGGGVASLVRATGVTFDPQFSACAQVTLTTAGTWWRLRSMSLPVTAGREYTASTWVRGTAGNVAILILWINSGGGTISESTLTTTIGTTWDRIARTAVAPAGAVTARIEVSRSETTVGTTLMATGFLFEEASTLRDYFDGATPNTSAVSWIWAGTADNSVSIETTKTFYPTALERYRASRAGRTLVHDVLNTVAPDVSFRPFGLRSGSLALAFDGAATAHAFVNAASITPQTLTLTAPEVPGIEMSFVVAGDDLGIEQDSEASALWFVTVPFQEVPA